MKLYHLLLLSCLSLLSCKKKPPELTPEPVSDLFKTIAAHRQFVQLEMKGKNVLWIQNDSLPEGQKDNLYVTGGIGYLATYIPTLFTLLEFEMPHPSIPDKRFEKINFVFYRAVTNDDNLPGDEIACQYARPNLISKVLTTGFRTVNSDICNIKARDGSAYMTTDLFEPMEGQSLSYTSRASYDKVYCSTNVNQENSTFEIISFNYMDHPISGRGWMLEANFKLKMYDDTYVNEKECVGKVRCFVRRCLY